MRASGQSLGSMTLNTPEQLTMFLEDENVQIKYIVTYLLHLQYDVSSHQSKATLPLRKHPRFWTSGMFCRPTCTEQQFRFCIWPWLVSRVSSSLARMLDQCCLAILGDERHEVVAALVRTNTVNAVYRGDPGSPTEEKLKMTESTVQN